MAKLNILLLGGTGNLSAPCARALFAAGHNLAVLTRGRSAVPPEYRALHADRHDPSALRAALAGFAPDVVINFIGFEPAEVQADATLFRGRIAQYVFISSATVYAKPPRQLPITEDAPLGNDFWDYARAKLACERWLAQERAATGFPVTIVRPSHTYSHHWIPNPVSSSSYTFAARLEQGRPVFLPDGGATPWTLTAATDFAAGLAGLIGLPAAIGETVHITSDEALTWRQIYEEIASALSVASPEFVSVPTDFICQVAPRFTGTLKGDKAHPGVFDNAKLRRLVPGFRCHKPFRDGIRESVAWLRAHPEQRQFDPALDTLLDEVLTAWCAASVQKA